MESAEEIQLLPGTTPTQNFEFSRRQVTVRVFDPAPPTAFHVAVWPPELSSRQARQVHMEQHPSDWPARPSNSATIPPGIRHGIAVKLPKAL